MEAGVRAFEAAHAINPVHFRHKFNLVRAVAKWKGPAAAAARGRQLYDTGVLNCFGPLPLWFWQPSFVPRAIRLAARCYGPRYSNMLAALTQETEPRSPSTIQMAVHRRGTLAVLAQMRVVERERLVRVTWRRRETSANYFKKLVMLAMAFDYNAGPLDADDDAAPGDDVASR